MAHTLEADGLQITTDFETGNGKNIEKVDENRFRLQVEGDDSGYNYYFGVRVAETADRPRTLTLEVVPDPDFRDAGEPNFWGNLTTRIWYTKPGMGADGWGQFHHMPEFNFLGEGELELRRERFVIRFQTAPGNSVWLTNMNPLPHSFMTKILTDHAAEHGHLMRMGAIGTSVEGREIHAVELTEGQGAKPVVFILSGQHPTEFPGQWAVWGIIRWLTSSVPRAVALRKRYRFHIVPQINPDGNVAGNPQKNAEGVNLSSAGWKDVCEGGEATGHENRLLWAFLKDRPPILSLNFHGYPGPRAWGSWPCEGCYVPSADDFADKAAAERQRILDDCLLWQTDAGSQYMGMIRLDPGAGGVCSALARVFGAVGLCYEPLDAKGPWNNMKTGVTVLQTAMNAVEAAPVHAEDAIRP